MKRIITLSLLLFFLYNAGGYFFCYKYYQSSIRQEIKQRIRHGLSNDQLTEIIVNKDRTVYASGLQSSNRSETIRWTHPNKEFRYGDAMFDVVRSFTKNGKTHYFCINDTKDKKLLAEFMKLRTRKLEKRAHSTSPLYFPVLSENRNFLSAIPFQYGEPMSKHTLNYPLKDSPPPKK